MVTSETIPQEGRPDKKLYQVTELGHQELIEWIAKPCEPTATKEELLIKIRAGYLVPSQVILEQLERHRQVHQEKLSIYQEMEQHYPQNPQ